KAIRLQEETLEKIKAELGPDHPGTLTAMNNLALAFKLSGQAAKAIALMEAIIGKRRTKLGGDHPDLLISTHKLARAYEENGHAAKAVPLLEGALEKSTAKLGDDLPRSRSRSPKYACTQHLQDSHISVNCLRF